MKHIKNVPDWARDKFYIVAKVYSDGEAWFFDAWDENEEREARIQSWEITGGTVFLQDEWE